ncbi:DExH-box ATP-dependent RNA helicase DExH18, mitochondrial [Cryptomeria japonica]|uniref:DExH-box ATP-dependent RNA helicase DExH18, mitochondrial n=1 Tax=Cryptomeria japonica TaxID=3369 RepID=UPI0027DA70DB|nr:DExH-box ATP-dependent RNA helicase DExH18, mitochondrial [Cryptomeria japonica]XP_057841684.2 DExH-box ATP-dependent RNA helicase DExH18, mitochondrial [Cryptomeria japonica]
MIGGQMAVLRTLVLKKVLLRRLGSLKSSCLEQPYFRDLDALESYIVGFTRRKSPLNPVHYRGVHSLSPSSADELLNQLLKKLKNGRCYSALQYGEKSAEITEAPINIPENDKNLVNSKDFDSSEEKRNSVKRVSDVQSRDPAVLFREMCQSTRPAQLTLSEKQKILEILQWFAHSGWACNQALALYIKDSVFSTAVSSFSRFVIQQGQRDMLEHLVRLGASKESVQFLFPLFAEFCMKEFEDEIRSFRSMVGTADLRKPHTWFPFARAMKRKIVYHCGPTNSGKTYNALQRFLQAKSGIYCGPLRLLAMEVFDKVNALGVYCSLHTGQEKKNIPFANHISCTIEMASTDVNFEVAVLDEIQMINDETRGCAWSRALLGLRADEIHLCGDPTVLKLVREICSKTGDDIIVHHYGRFKPLVVEAKTLQRSFDHIESGDCIVAFSRRELFEIRMAIEKFTKHRCCIIYGALPPETRKQQANLFNNQDNDFDVLVASDAIGMGLNLNIKRIVFYGLQKYNGFRLQHVPASQVKQIAGRAGRRGSPYPEGLTTTFKLEDLDYLIDCLRQPFEECKSAGLFPFFEQIELFAGQLPNITFVELLETFAKRCVLDGSYFLCKHDHVKKVARMLEKIPELSLRERYNFCYAPVSTSDSKAMAYLTRFAQQYGKNPPVRLQLGVPRGSARNDLELLDLETKHQILSMYLWLSHHFREETFPYKERAEIMARDIVDLLNKSLAKACWKPESRNRKTTPPKNVSAVGRQLVIIKEEARRLVAC